MENQKSNNYYNARKYIALYLDMVIRGLISFVVIGIGGYIFLIGFLKMNFIFVLSIIFISSILVSPFLSRIKLGESLLIKYEELIIRIFKLE